MPRPKPRVMFRRNTCCERRKFPTRPRVGHHSGASWSAFLHDWTMIEGAAPLRQDSRVPRLSTYPRAWSPGYSQPASPAGHTCGCQVVTAIQFRLVQPALVAEPHHLVDESLLLLVVEGCKQRLGGVCNVALID